MIFTRADDFAAHADALRQAGRTRIVFTNGVFDLLHVGHVRYLQAARALGDALLVGVNSDDSVRRLKGPTRPINPDDERSEVIAALACVDGVCLFGEDRPDALLQAVRPSVHAKGGDYKNVDALPEAPLVRALGGEVVILPLVPGRSTTRLLERLGSEK